jgi:hypothetical protein
MPQKGTKMNLIEIKELIAYCREYNVLYIEVDGVKISLQPAFQESNITQFDPYTNGFKE